MEERRTQGVVCANITKTTTFMGLIYYCQLDNKILFANGEAICQTSWGRYNIELSCVNRK